VISLTLLVAMEVTDYNKHGDENVRKNRVEIEIRLNAAGFGSGIINGNRARCEDMGVHLSSLAETLVSIGRCRLKSVVPQGPLRRSERGRNKEAIMYTESHTLPSVTASLQSKVIGELGQAGVACRV
jgi:hypothetical protein